jgi:hypothetical protein
VPFRSQFAYHWDSAEFVLAVREYNVALSQPHAPGYFLYVMLGRLVNIFVGDPHASLVWMSVAFGAVLTGLLYLLGTAMFGRRAGLVVGLLVLTSPQTWFHSCVALAYIVDAFLVCLIVLCCWRALRRGCRWADAVIIGVLLAIAGGVRPQTVPGLMPLVAYTLWTASGRRLAKLAVALGVCVIGTLAWLAPMLRMSGGWAVYAEVFRRHATFNAPATFSGGGTNALLWNVFFTGLYCWNGLVIGTALLAGVLIVRVRMDHRRKQDWYAAHREALRVLALWIGPMMLFETMISFTKQPGYVLSYLPGLIILVAIAAGQLQKPAVFGVVTAVVCIVNAVVFLAWPRPWDGLFFHAGRTAREIREHDHQVAQMVFAIRNQLNPGETAICHAREYLPLGLRHLQLYLPEFEQYQLTIDPAMLSPADRPMMSIRGGQLDFVRGLELTGKRVLALIVPRGTSLEDYAQYFDVQRAKPLPESEGSVYTIGAEAAR